MIDALFSPMPIAAAVLIVLTVHFGKIFVAMRAGHLPRNLTGEPEAGARVLLMFDERARRAVVIDPFEFPCDDSDHFAVELVRGFFKDGTTRAQIGLYDEGWLWCRGWSKADETALLATWALRQEG